MCFRVYYMFVCIYVIMVSWFFIFVLVLGVAYFKEWVRKHSVCFYFLEKMEANWYGFFLKCSYRIHQVKVWGGIWIYNHSGYVFLHVSFCSIFEGLWPFGCDIKSVGIELLMVFLYYLWVPMRSAWYPSFQFRYWWVVSSVFISWP